MEDKMFMPGAGGGYDDEVLNAGWTDVPQVASGSQPPAETQRQADDGDVEGFLARLYAAQE